MYIAIIYMMPRQIKEWNSFVRYLTICGPMLYEVLAGTTQAALQNSMGTQAKYLMMVG